MSPSKDVQRFLDIRTHGFARVATVSPRVHLGNPGKNVEAHLELLTQARDAGVMYALCPELGLTGYSVSDLFFSQTLLESAVHALDALREQTNGWNMLITVGMPLRVDDMLFNCLATVYNGRVLRVTPKKYPPNYREFYEGRHFAGADEARTDTVTVFGNDIPFGTDTLIRCTRFPWFVQHDSNCEDDWVAVTVGDLAALAGATICANGSASNITIGKSEYRLMLMVTASGRRNCVQLYTSAGFGESSTDLSWDGHQIIAERGVLLGESDRFQLGGTMMIKDVDVAVCIQDRLQQTSFRQNAAHYRQAFRTVSVETLGSDSSTPYETFMRTINPHPFVPSDPAKRDERCRETFLIQATAVAKRLSYLPPRLQKLTIGVSGGQDSAHALTIATHAMDLLNLPRSNIIAITMPGMGTSDRTKANARRLMAAVGATALEIPIAPVVQTIFAAIGHDPGEKNLTYQNTQSWTRKLIELAVACERGGINLGTGDLSELALGWCTMFGDHASHYNPNSGVPKTLISYLIRWAADVIFEKEEAVRSALLDILDTPISPELLPPKDGVITQKTEDFLGPYELHDFALHSFIRFGFTPYRIARLALAAFGGKYDLAEIKNALRIFITRFFQTQVKRSCLPDGPKVGLTALSPRGDWRMPSDADPSVWLEDLARVPDTL